jgi:hypothetical protein
MMMCLGLGDQWKIPALEKATEEQDVSISNQFCVELILQTILVILEVNKKKWSVIAIIDTCSEQSYILKKTAL